MLEVISIILFLIIAAPVAVLTSKTDPKTGKARFPRTLKEWLGVLFITGFGFFLIIMHDYHEDLLGQIYTYIGSVILVIWGIAFIFFGADPRK